MVDNLVGEEEGSLRRVLDSCGACEGKALTSIRWLLLMRGLEGRTGVMEARDLDPRI